MNKKEKIFFSDNILTKDEVMNLKNLNLKSSLYYKTICEVCGKIFSMHVSKDRTICVPCWSRITQKKIYKENPELGKERFQKRTQSNLKKFGVANAFQRNDVKTKIKASKKDKYGDENFNNREKAKQTCLEKYGVEYSFQSMNNKLKARQTCLEKYGVEYSMQSNKIKDKAKETKLKRYGSKSFNNHKKYINTCLEKYGVEHAMQNLDVQKKAKKKYLYDDNFFDSSWELAFWIYAKDHNEEIERTNTYFEYELNGEKHKYFPDFMYKGQFIEIKGLQFFEDKNPSKKMINPFDKSQDDLFEAKHQCMLKNNVKILTNIDFAIDYVNEKYTSNYLGLFERNLSFPYLNEDLHDTSNLGLLHYFHKSIYEANKKGYKSPTEAWQDKDLVKKAALNRLKEVGHCTPEDIIRGFSVARIAPKVSMFSPTLASNLIKKYLVNCTAIVDPFSGFSGRLLGAIANNKTYIGKDLNEKHVAESNKIIKYKNAQNCLVVVENILKKNDIETYDSLFTCPPYEDKENWNRENDVSKTCDEWIDICMQKYKCKKYLFVVDKTEKYRNYVIDKIINKSHFGQNEEKVVLISKC